MIMQTHNKMKIHYNDEKIIAAYLDIDGQVMMKQYETNNSSRRLNRLAINLVRMSINALLR